MQHTERAAREVASTVPNTPGPSHTRVALGVSSKNTAPKSAPKARRKSVMHDVNNIPIAVENLAPLVLQNSNELNDEVELIRQQLSADGDWKDRVIAI